MIAILADLLADFSLRLPTLEVRPKDLHRVSYLEVGPGGACNAAIATARFGLAVAAFGEVGDDRFGRIVAEGLKREGVEIEHLVASPGARTPVATVLVDERGEPAYLGYPGTLRIKRLPQAWRARIATAAALYCDGWAEHEGVPDLVLAGLKSARAAGVATFFDPGPGHPHVDNGWHVEAASFATVLLVNEQEAARLSGRTDPVEAGQALLENGSGLVIVKRGAAGCLLLRPGEMEIAPGFPVGAVDTTGAGDSLAGAVIYGVLKGLRLDALGVLANAAGAAKVVKLGTGHNVPTLEEVRGMLARFGFQSEAFGLD
ncbi:MAG: carbohydrate kinase family protein [Candidatus Promineifilaceae bacterium]